MSAVKTFWHDHIGQGFDEDDRLILEALSRKHDAEIDARLAECKASLERWRVAVETYFPGSGDGPTSLPGKS